MKAEIRLEHEPTQLLLYPRMIITGFQNFPHYPSFGQMKIIAVANNNSFIFIDDNKWGGKVLGEKMTDFTSCCQNCLFSLCLIDLVTMKWLQHLY